MAMSEMTTAAEAPREPVLVRGGGFWFNPGPRDQAFVASIGAAF